MASSFALNTSVGKLDTLRPGLQYDSENTILVGKFADELSVHRAKKVWLNTLKSHFLLEIGRDFELIPNCILDCKDYTLLCVFSSTGGRYAFWKLITKESDLRNYEENIKLPKEKFIPSIITGEGKKRGLVSRIRGFLFF